MQYLRSLRPSVPPSLRPSVPPSLRPSVPPPAPRRRLQLLRKFTNSTTQQPQRLRKIDKFSSLRPSVPPSLRPSVPPSLRPPAPHCPPPPAPRRRLQLLRKFTNSTTQQPQRLRKIAKKFFMHVQNRLKKFYARTK